MLDAEHNFAPAVPGGIDVAMVASVKPRSKLAGDTTCKTDTRVWPRRKSNKLQWADVFCKLHTSYVSSIHTSCMAPRRGYNPWPLAHRLRLRMPHELPEPPVADPKWVAAQLPEGEPAESLQLYPSTPASRMRRAPWQRYKQSVTTYFDNKHWALVGTPCMYDIVTVLPVVTALRSCNVNPHVCAETQLTHLFICEILRTHLFACLRYMIVFSPNRFIRMHDPNNGGGNMHNSNTERLQRCTKDIIPNKRDYCKVDAVVCRDKCRLYKKIVVV